ncbi:hypothetical protein [Streptomyces acidiscabies]|uniref:Uncharacterized protein n=1 Tax=Streptomyces acidiscabies TaxID=42234 RepID=A0ABU4MCM8_9ACTN|nr:hypothetical protein [Streptomyces acidiscabies]MDX3024967.1 hypothetical protein [Streptomyces acidiscabies]
MTNAGPYLQQFSKELKTLIKAAKSPVLSSLLKIEGTEISDSTLSAWTNGVSAPSNKNAKYFEALIRHLNARVPKKADYVPRSLGQWSSLRQEARAEKDRNRGGRPAKSQPPARKTSHPRKNTPHEIRNEVFRKHRAWIEQFVLTDQLQNREEELRELEAFCAAGDGAAPAYVWWQAGIGAGKSALMAEFVIRRQPEDVEVVSYFIAERFGNNDRGSFLSGVGRHLTAVARRDVPRSGSRAEDFPELCQAAAQVCRERGRTLVLLVDGLDDDAGAGAGGLSIAALLPKNPPPGMRVVVAGRPNPPVSHVDQDHPLCSPGTVRRLTASPEARVILDRAEREVWLLLKDRPVGNTLLGFLSVARGALTGKDLAELVGVQPHEINERLGGITGRSFVPEDRSHFPEINAKAGSRPYVLGHDTLLHAALDGLGETAADGYEKQLHDWATGYRSAGWPPNTPSYLLYDYADMLRRKGDTERLASFVLDPGRQQVFLDRGSVDAALSEVELTRQVIESEAPDDLATLTALAASRDKFAEHASWLPVSIVSAFAKLGHPQRAMDLARTFPHPAVRAGLLARVARDLVNTDYDHAVAAAQEAARWVQRARREAMPEDESETEAAAGEAAIALISVGKDHQGRELLNSLSPYMNGDDTRVCEITVQAALAACPQKVALAEELLDRAEQRADELVHGHSADPTAPVRAWATVARAAGPERAARLCDRISEYARQYPACLESIDVLAAAASALVADRLHDAVALAQHAGQQLRTAFHAPESLPDSDASDLRLTLGSTLTSVAQALVDTGAVDEARGLVAAVPETLRVSLFEEDVLAGARFVIDGAPQGSAKQTPADELAQHACRLADQGQREEAKRRLGEAVEEFARSSGSTSTGRSWLSPVAAAFATIGDPSTAERLAKNIRTPGTRGKILAAVSAACCGAGHTADARRLAHEAADLAGTLEDADDYSLLHGAPGTYVSAVKAAAACALALVGEVDRASSLVEEAENGYRSDLLPARLALAAALRTQAPETAARLMSKVREGILADHQSRARRLVHPDDSPARQRSLADSAWSGLVTEHAELLAATGAADRTCQSWLAQALRETRSRGPEARSLRDELVIVILTARSRPDRALQMLKRLQAETNPYEYPERSLVCAVAHAVLGDLTAARQAAQEHAVPIVRAEAMAAVAAYLARVPVNVVSTMNPIGTDRFGQVLHALALMQTPGAAPDLDQSRRFLNAALAGDGWQFCIPTLAHIAPDAVAALRDVVVPIG